MNILEEIDEHKVAIDYLKNGFIDIKNHIRMGIHFRYNAELFIFHNLMHYNENGEFVVKESFRINGKVYSEGDPYIFRLIRYDNDTRKKYDKFKNTRR